ncbi:MAG: hypothetical protein WA951_13010 [Leeuwenhoekiella sp.]
MNTVFVSGTLNSPAQLKMGDQGYLVTFKMTHEDELKDSFGNSKQVLTEWSVSLQYNQEPTEIIEKLDKGKKVLVKGNAKIEHQEGVDDFTMSCSLNGLTLNFMDAATKRAQKNVSQQFAELRSSAIAS